MPSPILLTLTLTHAYSGCFFSVGGARERREQRAGVVGNLDPNLPLMQLFLQTLLPWNNVR